MPTVDQALHAALQAPPPPAAPAPAQVALVIGAGGVLGSALLAEALVAGRFARVHALTAGPLRSTLRGLQPMSMQALDAGAPLAVDLAFVVFERARRANGRDDAFVMPAPGDLLPLARRLRAAGVRRLLVVLPHAPALLPQALAAGFADADEARVGALGFEQLLFVRAAQDVQGAAAAAPAGAPRWLRGFVAWWFSQLRWMVPQREQALRSPLLARVVVQLAQRLAAAPPGTRIVPQPVLWQAAQPGADGAALWDAWLGARPGDRPPR